HKLKYHVCNDKKSLKSLRINKCLLCAQSNWYAPKLLVVRPQRGRCVEKGRCVSDFLMRTGDVSILPTLQALCIDFCCTVLDPHCDTKLLIPRDNAWKSWVCRTKSQVLRQSCVVMRRSFCCMA
ncbi:hypothetical protein NDU88_002723, partial [Pleurodeles waltl]